MSSEPNSEPYKDWFGRIMESFVYFTGAACAGLGVYNLSQYPTEGQEAIGWGVFLLTTGAASIFGGTKIRKCWKIEEKWNQNKG